ncbi:MAG: hypothetical protein MK033_03375 [Candidatus Caenarcaniphilales bacterium]|nr:hypothetical protein [Candidatus Caenarcaniphilales bacterium]
MSESSLDVVKVILDSNLLNFAVVVGLILYYFPKTIRKLVLEKREDIQSKSKRYEELKQKHVEKLSLLEAKVSSLNVEAEKIVSEAEDAAKLIRKNILAAAEKEIEAMKDVAMKEIEIHKKQAFEQVRESFVNSATETVENMFLEQIKSGEDTKNIAAFKSLEPVNIG